MSVHRITGFAVLLLLVASASAFGAPASASAVTIDRNGGLGVIRGIVRDESGNPIADATVAIFRGGTSKLLKQVSSASDGSFIAKIIPGTYTVLAVAQGFNPITLFGVEVGKAAEVSYGFKLERAGSGNTLPEKKLDRSSSKWRIRAMQQQRSIYQNQEGDTAVAESDDEAEDTPESPRGRGQTVVETYFANARGGNYGGVNFATLVPVSGNAEFVFAGQIAKGKNAPQRFETTFRFRPATDHQVRLNASAGYLGKFEDRSLGQFSFQATDEWKVREGVILVLGFDYSRFAGAGNDSSISPRLGLQFDLDPKTRVRTAYTAETEQRSWADAIELEGQSIGFTEPVSVEDLFVVNRKPRMNKSRRLEFGVERILDNRSSIEATGFLDTTLGRGVGLNAFSFDALDGSGFSDLVADQQGRATGVRVVYSRRINSVLTTRAGYSFGSGQRLSEAVFEDPSDVFDGDIFHSFFAELTADLRSGTHVKTIFRLSPQATVFAIDPFKGRLAIYDPGLSVLVTQSLPTLGLPFKAQAIVDARNLFDSQSGIQNEEGGFRLASRHRMFRGGIQVRF